MSRHLVPLVAVLLAAAAARAQDDPEPIRVATYNIRYGTAADGPDAWGRRRDAVAATIARLRPQVLGVQEALAFQLDFLADELPDYARIGQGRLGGEGGEHCALLIDRRRFEVTRSGDLWLSETPRVVASKGWDAALPRIVSWAVLRDRRDDSRLLVANTHFDHRGRRARRESARLLVRWLRGFAGLPRVLMGDLNTGERSAPVGILRAAGLCDSLRVVHPETAAAGTFNGFHGAAGGGKIDYVLVDHHWRVAKAAIDRPRTADGRNPSDHDPVWADLVVRRPGPPRLMPVLDGASWHLTGRPEVGAVASPKQQVVDHALFRAADGRWQLWACVRHTTVGRVLHRWAGADLRAGGFEPEGVVMRADAAAGESLDDWNGQEWIQAPYVFRHGDGFAMLYGGHRSESGDCQICLATSADGRSFERHRDARGYSRVFVGPGEARDPMVVEIGGTFYCYYSGHDPGARAPCEIYCRTSADLLGWSEPVAVNWGGSAGNGNWSAECPFVVARFGYYYLFRTSSYRAPLTHVYRSADPLDFGRGDDSKKIGTIAVAAPELVEDGGETFVTSVHDLAGGVQCAHLRWLDERRAPTAMAAERTTLWDFEDGTLQGWERRGRAFADQPTYAPEPGLRGQHFGHRGSWLVATYERRPDAAAPAGGTQGDEPTGSLRSPDLTLPDGWLTFSIGGGRDRERLFVALVLAYGDVELCRATGGGSNEMRRVAWDVSEHAGARAYLRVVDAASGAWGHIDVDAFELVGEAPR